MRCVIILSILVALGGCDPQAKVEPRTIYDSASFSRTNDQERFKQALAEAGVQFEVVTEQSGKQLIRWEYAYSAQVKRINDTMFPPPGRSIRFDPERQFQFKEWLEKNGVPYRTMMVQDDGEYVVWEEVDAKRVRAWPDFPAYFDDPPIPTQR